MLNCLYNLACIPLAGGGLQRGMAEGKAISVGHGFLRCAHFIVDGKSTSAILVRGATRLSGERHPE